MKNELAIIIPSYNRKGLLATVLDQIKYQETSFFTFITIVVNDGSTDGTSEMLSTKYPEVHVINGNGKWFWTKCINEGTKYAIQTLNANYILFLNDDSSIRSNFLNKIYFSALKNDNSIVTSMSVDINKPHLITFCGVKSINKITLKKNRYISTRIPLNNLPTIYKNRLLPTVNMNGRGTIIPQHILEKLNHLDLKLIQYGSDDDFALRAIKKGYKVFIDTSCIIYDNTSLTSEGAAFLKGDFMKFLKSFFNPYAVNSLKKTLRFTYKHHHKILLPFYLFISIAGTFKSYFFNYRK